MASFSQEKKPPQNPGRFTDALWQAAQSTLERLRSAPQTTSTAEMIDQQLQQLGSDLRQASQRQGEIRALLNEDDQRSASLTTLLAEIAAEQQHTICGNASTA